MSNMTFFPFKSILSSPSLSPNLLLSFHFFHSSKRHNYSYLIILLYRLSSFLIFIIPSTCTSFDCKQFSLDRPSLNVDQFLLPDRIHEQQTRTMNSWINLLKGNCTLNLVDHSKWWPMANTTCVKSFILKQFPRTLLYPTTFIPFTIWGKNFKSFTDPTTKFPILNTCWIVSIFSSFFPSLLSQVPLSLSLFPLEFH